MKKMTNVCGNDNNVMIMAIDIGYGNNDNDNKY